MIFYPAVYLPWIHRASTVRPPCKYRACAAPLPRKQVDNCALELLAVEQLVERHAAAASSPEVLMVESRLCDRRPGPTSRPDVPYRWTSRGSGVRAILKMAYVPWQQLFKGTGPEVPALRAYTHIVQSE